MEYRIEEGDPLLRLWCIIITKLNTNHHHQSLISALFLSSPVVHCVNLFYISFLLLAIWYLQIKRNGI